MARSGVVGPLSQSPAAALQNMMRGGGSNALPTKTATASSAIASSIENGINHSDRNGRKKVN